MQSLLEVIHFPVYPIFTVAQHLFILRSDKKLYQGVNLIVGSD